MNVEAFDVFATLSIMKPALMPEICLQTTNICRQQIYAMKVQISQWFVATASAVRQKRLTEYSDLSQLLALAQSYIVCVLGPRGF